VGTLFRAALDALRAAPEPVTVREIADAVLAAKGVTDATGKTVKRAGDGVPKRWRLT
jgi:hypothetical protein